MKDGRGLEISSSRKQMTNEIPKDKKANDKKVPNAKLFHRGGVP